MNAFQQIKTEVEDRQGARRRLIARALLAIRHFISVRKKIASPLRRDR
jgi:hypothetical protein